MNRSLKIIKSVSSRQIRPGSKVAKEIQLELGQSRTRRQEQGVRSKESAARRKEPGARSRDKLFLFKGDS